MLRETANVTATLYSNRGFSLVELLVALVIMIVGLLGLLEAVNVAIQANTRNQMRNEATQVGDVYMNKMRVTPFSLISTTYQDYSVASRQKGWKKKYTISRTGAKFGAYSASRELVVQVRWTFKNTPNVLELRSVKSK